MKRLYRVLTSAVPAPFDVWLRAHEAEFAVIETRKGRTRWALGLIPLSLATFGQLIVRSPRSLVGGTLMRTIVGTLSIVNLVAGIGLAVLYLADTNPPIVAVLSAVLIVQGLFSLALLSGAFGNRYDAVRHVQLVGSTLALVVGLAGVLAGMVTNLAAATTDPEFGPMTVAMLLAVHGLFSLIAFGDRNGGLSTDPTVR